MSIEKFFKNQFRLRSLLLKHDRASDFYLSCFQKNQSTIPLLIIRIILFVGCMGTLISSLVLTTAYIPINYWPIYMTHWGLIMNTITACFALLSSIIALLKTPEEDSGIPWYDQVYWASYNIATPIAFFITVFYWTLLTDLDQDFAFNYTLDVFIHGVNSILMCAFVICSRHPTYFLHFYMSVGFGIIYLVFSYVYYVTGGTDSFGQHAIYPMLNWRYPGITLITAVICMVGIIIMHVIMVGLSALRDFLTRPLREENKAYNTRAAYF